MYHPGLWACPKEGTFDAGKVARYNERRSAAKAAMKAPRETPPPGSTATPGTTTTGTPPATGSSSILQRIELGTQVAETARRDASQPQAPADWLLPADSSETFFGTIRNAVKMVANWLDDVLEAKKTTEGEIKDSVFEMNQHDISAARGGFGQRFATKIVKSLGAKTLEEGIATVDSLAFIVMFGTMFLAVIGHFIKVGGESPRLKKLREGAARRKQLAEERQAAAELSAEQKRNAIPTSAKPGGA